MKIKRCIRTAFAFFPPLCLAADSKISTPPVAVFVTDSPTCLRGFRSGSQSPPQTGCARGCLSLDIVRTRLPRRHSGDLSEVSVRSNEKKKKSLCSPCFPDSRKQCFFGGCSSSARAQRGSSSSNPSFRHNTQHFFLRQPSRADEEPLTCLALSICSAVICRWDFRTSGALKRLPGIFRDAKRPVYLGVGVGRQKDKKTKKRRIPGLTH